MPGGQHHCFANIVASSLDHGLRCQWPAAGVGAAPMATCASWTRRDLPPVASCFPMPPLLYALTRGPFANDGLLLPLAALTSLTVRLGGRGANGHLRLVDSSRLTASGRLLSHATLTLTLGHGGPAAVLPFFPPCQLCHPSFADSETSEAETSRAALVSSAPPK